MSIASTSRYERGHAWSVKARALSPIIYGAFGLQVVLLPAQLIVKDAFWSWVIAGLSAAIAVTQIVLAVRSAVFFRRARRIWNGSA